MNKNKKFMKNLQIKLMISFLLIAVSGLFSACGNEEAATDDPRQEGNGGKLTFSIPKHSSAVTYGEGITGTQAENRVDELIVYMVNGDGAVEKIYRTDLGEVTLSSGADNRHWNATIDVAGMMGVKKFYLLANVGEKFATNQDTTPTIEAEILGMESTDLHHVIALSNTPIAMIGSVATDGDIAAANTPLTVSLRRRVARFDIENPLGASFHVKKVSIYNARKNVKLFADNAIGTHQDLSDGFEMDLPFATSKQGAFYLYPTVLGNNLSRTRIQLDGSFEGDTDQSYDLVIKNNTGLQDIEANNIYVIRLQDNGSKTTEFEITVANWSTDLNLGNMNNEPEE
jgi:hypothetical protein